MRYARTSPGIAVVVFGDRLMSSTAPELSATAIESDGRARLDTRSIGVSLLPLAVEAGH
jgi:hypothetical protein